MGKQGGHPIVSREMQENGTDAHRKEEMRDRVSQERGKERLPYMTSVVTSQKVQLFPALGCHNTTYHTIPTCTTTLTHTHHPPHTYHTHFTGMTLSEFLSLAAY